MPMRQLMLIHPFGQAFALVFGIFNALTGITRRWFSLPIHINCGALYYFCTLVGAGIGSLIAEWMRTKGVQLDMQVHRIAALLMVTLIAAGATTGLIMLRKPAVRMRLLRYHRWINLISLLLFIVQGLGGGLTALHLWRG